MSLVIYGFRFLGLSHACVAGRSGESPFNEIEDAFAPDSSQYALWCSVDFFKEALLNLQQRIVVEVFCFDAEQEIV